MEEDTKNNLRKHQHMYNIILNELNNLLEKNLKNEDFQNQTFLPNEFVYYNDEWNTKIKEDDKKHNENI